MLAYCKADSLTMDKAATLQMMQEIRNQEDRLIAERGGFFTGGKR